VPRQGPGTFNHLVHSLTYVQSEFIKRVVFAFQPAMNDFPLALFITWTVYGTFLPGDHRGWSRREQGMQIGRTELRQWHVERLQHPMVTLNAAMRDVAEAALREICSVRAWTLWAVSVRSNHVHVVVSASSHEPTVVRDQLKAKATGALRKQFTVWENRPIWSVKGDLEFLDRESEIEQCVTYVLEAQDRMEFR